MKIYSRALTTIGYPGAQATQLTGINGAGVLVGATEDGQGVWQGFLYKRGSFQSFPLPPTPPGGPYFDLGGINDAGLIVGTRFDDQGLPHAFLLTPSGTGGAYTWADLALPFPDASESSACGINDAGDIVGGYAGVGGWYGFVLQSGGGAVSLTVPQPGTKGTGATGLNSSGAIVGSSCTEDDEGNLQQHGFLFSGGTFTQIDYPGADWTWLSGINGAGDIVGGYRLAEASYHSFLWRQGSFSPFDVPTATWTELWGINDAGSIVGNYMDAQDHFHGFVSQRFAVNLPLPRGERLAVPIHVLPPWARSRSEARGV